MLITIVLLLFKLEDKKRASWGGYKSQWSALRVFNWQHSNSYIMLNPTDLFCHIVLFAKFNMLASCHLHFLANIDFPVEQGHSVSPIKYGGIFFLKRSWQMEDNFWGTLPHGGLMPRSCQGQGRFTNAFFNNLKTVNFCQS